MRLKTRLYGMHGREGEQWQERCAVVCAVCLLLSLIFQLQHKNPLYITPKQDYDNVAYRERSQPEPQQQQQS